MTTKPVKQNTQTSEGTYDWGLLTIVATLLALGNVMVFSASYAQGIAGYDNPFFFFMRQLMWMSIGLGAMVVAMRVPYHYWQRWSVPLMGVSLLALMGVIAFGTKTFGSTRTFFGGSVQPSEPAKVIIIIYVSAWLASKGSRIRDVQVGLLPFSVLMGIITVLLVSQPDISTSMLIVATACIMFFIAGAELRQLLLIGVGGGVTFWMVVQYSSYANRRIERYLESVWNPLESREWQTTRTVRALLNGGIFGEGLGGGDYKLPGGVPLAWSDNIFAIIGEELGLLGALLVILLFSLLVYRGLRTALRAPDTFGMLLAIGITSLLALQALLNAAVVVAIAPPTGVTLPFISYGGSSLVTVLGAVGILLSISRSSEQSLPEIGSQNLYARFNLRWGNGRSRLPRTGRSATSNNSARNSGRHSSRSSTTGGGSGRGARRA